MIPRYVLAVALAAFTAPSSAFASYEIVQTSSNQAAVQGGFYAFDTSLGTLTDVIFSVSTRNERMGVVRYPIPSDVTYPITVDWSIAGRMLFEFQPYGGLMPSLWIDTAGSGQATVERDAGAFFMSTSGSQVFHLDPALFTVKHSTNPYQYDFAIHESDPGLYSGADVSLSSNQNVQLAPVTFYCSGPVGGSEACNRTGYRLTYVYESFVPSVPEPGTWATMLLGFGAIGASLRKRKRTLALPA